MMHKLRSLLTMLGMIFGVAAVIAMLSIGAGARAQVMALIEQMGVRNVIVEAHEANAWEDMQKVRKVVAGAQPARFSRDSIERERDCAGHAAQTVYAGKNDSQTAA